MTRVINVNVGTGIKRSITGADNEGFIVVDFNDDKKDDTYTQYHPTNVVQTTQQLRGGPYASVTMTLDGYGQFSMMSTIENHDQLSGYMYNLVLQYRPVRGRPSGACWPRQLGPGQWANA